MTRVILIEQARRKATVRRGGGRQRQDIEHVLIAVEDDATDLEALSEALDRLEREDPKKRRCGSSRQRTPTSELGAATRWLVSMQ